METQIMTEIQTEIKALLKQAWIDIKFEYAKAKAEVQLEEHQKVIDKLAIQAQLEIDELKQQHTHLR